LEATLKLANEASVQIHLVGVFIADFLITTGTFFALRRRSSGLER
jgi:hypothetical protein